MKNDNIKRVKDIGEIAFLRFKNIPLIKIDTYEKKSICWFQNINGESDSAILEYYNNGFSGFYSSIKESRQFLFNRIVG